MNENCNDTSGPIKRDKYTIKALYNIGNRQKQKKATKLGDCMAELKKR